MCWNGLVYSFSFDFRICFSFDFIFIEQSGYPPKATVCKSPLSFKFTFSSILFSAEYTGLRVVLVLYSYRQE